MTSLLYSDPYLAVVRKDAGILSQGDDRGRENLPDLLQKELGGEIFPVHRLDRETAGVMVFARSAAAAAAFGRAMENGLFRKEYLAVLWGVPEKAEGELSDLLFFDRRVNKVFPVKRTRRGVKEAFLSYRVLAEREGKALVQVFPKTGRTHQIRVQFASRKTPLYGDRKYGGAGDSLALFCRCLAFPHPVTGDPMHFSSSPDPRFPWTLFEGAEGMGE